MNRHSLFEVKCIDREYFRNKKIFLYLSETFVYEAVIFQGTKKCKINADVMTVSDVLTVI